MPAGARPGATPLIVVVVPGGRGDRSDRLGVGRGGDARRASPSSTPPRTTASGRSTARRATADVDAVTGLLDRTLAGGCFDAQADRRSPASRTAPASPRAWPARCPTASPPSCRSPPATARSTRARRPRAPRSWTSTAPPTPSSPTTASARTAPARSRATPRAGRAATAAPPARPRRTPRRLVTRVRYRGCDAGLRVERLRLVGDRPRLARRRAAAARPQPVGRSARRASCCASWPPRGAVTSAGAPEELHGRRCAGSSLCRMIAARLSRRADELRAARTPFVVATVVRAQRPTSVRTGDAALVLGDGTIEGFVGGACAEQSVRLHALRALETGEALLLRILPGDDEAPAAEGAVTVQNPCLSGGSLEIFLEPMLALAARARGRRDADRRARWRAWAPSSTSTWSSCPAPTSSRRPTTSRWSSPRTGATSCARCAAALEAGLPYVGLVASRVRGSAVVAELHAEGVAEERLATLETPAGLDIGARTPEEIALSILARIVAVRRGEQTLSVRVVAPGRERASRRRSTRCAGWPSRRSSRRRTSTTRAGASTSAARAAVRHLDTLTCPAVGSVAVATRSRRQCTWGPPLPRDGRSGSRWGSS